MFIEQRCVSEKKCGDHVWVLKKMLVVKVLKILLCMFSSFYDSVEMDRQKIHLLMVQRVIKLNKIEALKFMTRTFSKFNHFLKIFLAVYHCLLVSGCLGFIFEIRYYSCSQTNRLLEFFLFLFHHSSARVTMKLSYSDQSKVPRHASIYFHDGCSVKVVAIVSQSF